MTIDDSLLDAVADVLESGGMRQLSISSVAEQAGLSRVTLHRWGVTLDDLVVGVLARASDDLRASLWPVVTAAGDAADRLRDALSVLCAVAERHAAVLTAFFAEPARPIPDKPARTTSFEFIEPFERLLRDGQLDGSLTVDDPARQAVLTANVVCWSYLHMRRAHGWSARRTTEDVVDLAIAHLLPAAVAI